ncbi:MAG: AMP-binding protein, partial [bacterium]|nr:AMP-binding protein [bacterium]
DLPFEKLVEELEPERDLSRTPLFQVLFNLLNMPSSSPQLPGLAVEVSGAPEVAAKFDLSLFAVEQGDGGILLQWVFNAELFDASTIQRLRIHFGRLLEAVVKAPDTRLDRLPLLGRSDEQQLLREWNDTAAAAVPCELAHTACERQAEGRGQRIAVAWEGGALSYGELNARANRLAHELRARGVGVDAAVGLCLERSPELAVAVLAVLKAGAACVPLDPAYPEERLAFMIADAAASLILTQARLLPRLPPGRATVLCLDRDSTSWAGRSTANPTSSGDSSAHLAYVAYTSGSTGRPKGAMIPHRALVSRLHWMQEAYRLTPADAVLGKAPISVDVAVWELLWPLGAGARTVLARPGGAPDAAYLRELILRERVSVVHFVPSMLELYLRQPG